MNLIRTLALCAILLPVGAQAAGSIQIDDPWLRASAPTVAVSAGYAVLTNLGATEDRLLAVETAAAGAVEIHTMETVEGVMRMRALPDGLPLPPGQAVKLAAGGLHLMLLDLPQQLQPGTAAEMTFRFAIADPVTVSVPVRAIAARGDGGHSGH